MFSFFFSFPHMYEEYIFKLFPYFYSPLTVELKKNLKIYSEFSSFFVYFYSTKSCMKISCKVAYEQENDKCRIFLSGCFIANLFQFFYRLPKENYIYVKYWIKKKMIKQKSKFINLILFFYSIKFKWFIQNSFLIRKISETELNLINGLLKSQSMLNYCFELCGKIQ